MPLFPKKANAPRVPAEKWVPRLKEINAKIGAESLRLQREARGEGALFPADDDLIFDLNDYVERAPLGSISANQYHYLWQVYRRRVLGEVMEWNGPEGYDWVEASAERAEARRSRNNWMSFEDIYAQAPKERINYDTCSDEEFWLDLFGQDFDLWSLEK